jgi:hypothetical protein
VVNEVQYASTVLPTPLIRPLQPHGPSFLTMVQFFFSSSFSTVHDVLTPYSACHHFPRPHIRYASKVNIHPYTRPPPLTAFNETLAETKNVNRLVVFPLCLSKKIGFKKNL